MARFFFAKELTRPEDVIPHLARGERHWRRGYSAYELAHSWIGADDIPTPVRAVLDTCPDYRDALLIEGLVERDVDLRTPGRRSQTDLLALTKVSDGLAVIAVEGKVDEPFGPFVRDWNDHTPGKVRRLEALCATLDLRVPGVTDIRYQLLHRTASAIYEAQRCRSEWALMLVHSFSAADTSFVDLQAFARLMGMPLDSVNSISKERLFGEDVWLRLGWVKDRPCQ